MEQKTNIREHWEQHNSILSFNDIQGLPPTACSVTALLTHQKEWLLDSELQVALDVLEELDFSNLTFEELNGICEFIEEFHFDANIINFLKTQWIQAFIFQIPWWSSSKIVLKKDVSNNQSNIHLQDKITLTLNRVLIDGKMHNDGVEYFSWITFQEEPSILIFKDNRCTFSFIIEEETVNWIPVAFVESLENIEDWEERYNNTSSIANHLYMRSWNKIIPLDFIDYVVWSGSSQSDNKMIVEGKEYIIFFLDNSKQNVMYFDWEWFSPLQQFKITPTWLWTIYSRLN